MAPTHSTNVTIEIVGIEANIQGRSCEQHETCGCFVKEDIVLSLRKVQVLVNWEEESVIAANVVSDGFEGCWVGFLKKHLVKHWRTYEGALVQVTEIFSKHSLSPTKKRLHCHYVGCCVAAIISLMPSEASEQKEKSGNKSENINIRRRSKRPWID